MNIRALIVDDERLARLRIRQMAELEPKVEIIGESAGGLEAIEFIRAHHPDLVFLDIQMPEISGFDVLQALSADERPAVIFVTASDHHALGAFDVHALDYLLKPFKAARFQEAMQRARDHFCLHPAGAIRPTLPEHGVTSQIPVKSGDRTTFIQVETIDYIEAASNYAILHVGAKSHILRETLKNLAEKLPSTTFMRVSRSAIVNLGFVSEARQAAGHEHLVVLKNGKEIRATCGIREMCRRIENR